VNASLFFFRPVPSARALHAPKLSFGLCLQTSQRPLATALLGARSRAFLRLVFVPRHALFLPSADGFQPYFCPTLCLRRNGFGPHLGLFFGVLWVRFFVSFGAVFFVVAGTVCFWGVGWCWTLRNVGGGEPEK
jgi:hypothetical protein